MALQLDRLLDPHLGGVQTGGDDGLVDLRGAAFVELEGLLGATGLDHHDGDVAVVEFTTCDHDLEGGVLALFERRVRDPRSVLAVGEANRTDRAVERDARDHERRGCGVDREHVVRVDLVCTDDGDHDLGLVAVAVGERRAKRAVGEATREDRLLARAAFATEERSGDLSCGVCALFDVHGEGEEVDSVANALGGIRGGEHLRLADAGDHCALRLQSELSGLEGECFVGARNWCRYGDGVSHVYVLSSVPRRVDVSRPGVGNNPPIPSRQSRDHFAHISGRAISD